MVGDECLGGSLTARLDVVLEQNDGVEVGVEQCAGAAAVARDTHELGADAAQVDVAMELHRTTVHEPVVRRRTCSVI